MWTAANGVSCSVSPKGGSWCIGRSVDNGAGHVPTSRQGKSSTSPCVAPNISFSIFHTGSSCCSERVDASVHKSSIRYQHHFTEVVKCPAAKCLRSLTASIALVSNSTRSRAICATLVLCCQIWSMDK